MIRLPLLVLPTLLSVISLCQAQPADSAASRPYPELDSMRGQTLRIGTKQAAPFSMKKADGSWEGISIDLWREIALNLGLDYEFVETDLDGLIQDTETGELDAAVAALSVTAEREMRVDFTHPFYSGGLGIAVRQRGDGGWLAILRNFISLDFLGVVLLLFASMLVVGGIVWFFERRANPEQFPDATLRGIGSGIWWAVVTLTTVGYGDKAPVTVPGRIIAVLWMFSALIIVAGFTASLTSVLTISELNTSIQSPADLNRFPAGAIANSVGAVYLESRNINFKSYDSVHTGLSDVSNRRIDAMVHDAPILQYWINQHAEEPLVLLPNTVEERYYAIALPKRSPLRKAINTELLRIRQSRDWEMILQQHLGE